MLSQSCRSSIGPWVPAMWSTLRRCFLLSLMDRGRKLPVLQRFVAGPQAVIDNLLLPLARDWDGFSATRTNFSLATSGWFRLGFTQARFAPLGETCPLLLHIGGSCATEKLFNGALLGGRTSGRLIQREKIG